MSPLRQPAFIELNKVEVGGDIFPSFAAGLFQEMVEARFLYRRVGMSHDHGLIPFLDFFRSVTRGVRLHPRKNCIVALEFERGFFESVRIDFEKAEQVLIETYRLVVITVEQPLVMQTRLVDQSRQMNVIPEALVRAAGKGRAFFAHG